ncbi:expressed unknown protein [Ectocarpus siliculosus]|uniref:Uncharacterized protein n=1 Tax=Ectocarpus siliculosus TaxID=2880 RepID=D7FNC7_ECTSI|nr:expressed unknown protein [Ectocarpus siliculosus]|eukprot:CBJ30181.1 expressed unknown protein [Ectocarpus siliculosus]
MPQGRIASPSEALTVIVPAPHQNKRLYAPELLNARASEDNQVTNAEDVVAEHPLPGYIVPVQASADDAEPLTTEIKVEQQQQQQQQHRPDSTEAVKNFFTKTSAGRVFSRGLLTKGFEKLYTHAADTTASFALGYFSSLRFGGNTPALLATLVTAAGTLSVASAATTSCLSAGTTVADIGSRATTDVPGDLADDATWALFSLLMKFGGATVLARIMQISALSVLATLAFWATSRSRKNGASVSPNNPPTAVGTPAAAAAAAPAMPPAGTPPAAAAAPAADMPAVAAASTASTASTASNPVDSHVGTLGSPAPASTEQAQPVANPPAAPEPEPRVGRGLRRAMQRLFRGITLARMAAKVKEAASEVDVDEVVSSVREFFSDVDDALGDVMDVVG